MSISGPGEFFRVLYDGCEGVIELRALKHRGAVARAFVATGDDPEALRVFLRDHQHDDLYFGVATRKDSNRGDLQNCHHLPAMFIDVDFKTTPNAQARSRILDFPLPPSAIVRSGGGMHLYWLLREPLDLAEDEDPARSVLRRLAHAFGGDLAAAEPARILRVPGTKNPQILPGAPGGARIPRRRAACDLADFDFLPAEPPSVGRGQSFVLPEEIPENTRNDTLYKYARRLHAQGSSQSEILSALREVNAQRCKLPLEDTEVISIARKANHQSDRSGFGAESDSAQKHDSQATKLVELVAAAGAELFHTPDGEPFATISVNGHRETWPIKGRPFRTWQARTYYTETSTAPGEHALKDAAGVLAGQALFEPHEHPVFTRIGERAGAIYVDLADDSWAVVEITAIGWRLVTDAPVKFRRTRGMLPLPPPARGEGEVRAAGIH